MWVVMRASRFDAMELTGGPGPWGNVPVKLLPPTEEPYWYLPVFDTYEAALRWEEGDPRNIREIRR